MIIPQTDTCINNSILFSVTVLNCNLDVSKSENNSLSPPKIKY